MENVTKAVLFDHDDTLVGTIQAKWAQHKHIAKTFYNREISDDLIHLHWGKPLTVLVKELYETNDIDQAMSYNIATRNLFPKVLFRHTLSTLRALREQGRKVGIITSTTLSSLKNDFATLHIPQNLFDYIQTEDDTAFHKPDSRVFSPTTIWLNEQEIDPKEVLYVGDSFKDMKAAIGAGFHFIGVTTGLVSPEEFDRENITKIDQLANLITLIKN